MDEFFAGFAVRAATIDELLSDAFEPSRGQKPDADLAARRLSAWCRSCASGDWSLFARRLSKDNLPFERVLARFATVRRNPACPMPTWVADAQWIDAVVQYPAKAGTLASLHSVGAPQAFEGLLAPIVDSAQELIWKSLPKRVVDNLSPTGLYSLCHSLLRRLSELTAPCLFNDFASLRGKHVDQAEPPTIEASSRLYDQFVNETRHSGFRRLFEARPVLLRLLASTTRQWIEATEELLLRLDADLPLIRCDLLNTADKATVARVTSDLGDPHNFGRTVQLIQFEDGRRVVYEPRDVRLNSAWRRLVDRLNAASPPVQLKVPRVIAQEGYGWSEFIEHRECTDPTQFEIFFQRAGAWLCLFHIFAGSDMHEENLIAAGDHPVPIDLETLLQPAETADTSAIPERHAFELAGRKIADSVLITGLLPAYGRSPENEVFAHGGLHDPQNAKLERRWDNVNTDAMEPVESWINESGLKNLPSYNGEAARLGDEVGALVTGFESYARFLSGCRHAAIGRTLFDEFADLPARRLLRPTRFYALLLERLKDYRNMGDGPEWSAHLDFAARLMDWDRTEDPWWPFLRAEREALASLNVPLFLTPTDTDQLRDAFGISSRTGAEPGLCRAKARFEAFDCAEVNWQSDVVRLSTSSVRRTDRQRVSTRVDLDFRPISAPQHNEFLRRAGEIAVHFSQIALRSGPGAAWIGLDWLRDSVVCQLAPLGADLYNGAPGVCVFLAAYANVTGDSAAADLASAGVSALRHDLRGINAGRFARALGIGGATGLGSVVYAFTLLSDLLGDRTLREDAMNSATLLGHDLVTADGSFDVMEGSAGCILCLLKLYRATGDKDILQHAIKCGEYLLRRRGALEDGLRLGWGPRKDLNGMSHGAAGYALALASLGKASSRSEFSSAAEDCITFENRSFSYSRANWPDFRSPDTDSDAFWPVQWCHGAGGIGFSRLTILKQWSGWTDGTVSRQWDEILRTDIRRAVDCVERAWPYPFDTLCCGSLGNIELLSEASRSFLSKERPHLREEASRRMAALVIAADQRGDFHWDVGDRRFNLGLFRGLAGVGYVMLRLVDSRLPNILVWE